jgi:O-methyltransferase
MNSDRQSKVENFYLETLKLFLTRFGFERGGVHAPLGYFASKRPSQKIGVLTLRLANYFLLGRAELAQWHPFDAERREAGADWPVFAETMIGLKRLNQLHNALETIESEKIPGNFLEAGVWRGGACIFAAAFLHVKEIEKRTIFAADSFEGLPRPEMKYPADTGDLHHTFDFLSVSIDEVEENFARYLIPTKNVVFVKGFFSESLKDLDCGPLAILRLDGDMYSSTTQVLHSLFDKISPGGFVIVDDWILPGVRKAVEDFLVERSLRPEIIPIDDISAFFRLPN